MGWAGNTGLTHRRICESRNEVGGLLQVDADQASRGLMEVLVKSAGYDRTHEQAVAGERWRILSFPFVAVACGPAVAQVPLKEGWVAFAVALIWPLEVSCMLGRGYELTRYKWPAEGAKTFPHGVNDFRREAGFSQVMLFLDIR